MFLFLLILVIMISSKLDTDVSQLAKNVHRILNDNLVDDSNLNSMRLLQFSYQIRQQRPTAGWGPITFDWALLYSLFAGVFSYMIVLLQFEMAGELMLKMEKEEKLKLNVLC